MSKELTPMSPPEEQGTATTAEVKPMSFTDKVAGVFTEPGATFENVHLTEKKTSDWLVPTIILIVIVVISTFIKYANPEIMADLQDRQAKQIQEKVKSGQMTQEQADRAIESIRGGFGKTMMYVGTAVGVPITVFVMLFLMCLIWWLVGKYALKGKPVYMKVVSVAGLASLISSLEAIIGAIIAVLQGKMMAGPNLALFVSDFSMANTMHRLLSSINPFTLWYLAVLGIGLAKISSANTGKSLIWVYGLWALWTVLYVFVIGSIPIFQSAG